MIADFFARIKNKQASRSVAAPNESVGPDVMQTPPTESPIFYSALKLEMRQYPGGKWAAISLDWSIAAVASDPEKAIVDLWRYIYAKGGVVAMTMATADLTQDERDARAS